MVKGFQNILYPIHKCFLNPFILNLFYILKIWIDVVKKKKKKKKTDLISIFDFFFTDIFAGLLA